MGSIRLKIILVSIVALFINNVGHSQSLILKSDSIPVPIFEDQVTTSPKFYLADNFLDDLEYYIEILDNSPLRFKVEISLVYPIEIAYAGTFKVQGWINKTNCGLYPRSREIENNRWYINLYETPYNTQNSIKVFEDNLVEQNGQIITVLNYKVVGDKYWYEILFYDNGYLRSGWTQDYCLQFTTCN